MRRLQTRAGLLAAAILASLNGCAHEDKPTDPLTGLHESIRPAPRPWSNSANKHRFPNGEITTGSTDKFHDIEKDGSGQFVGPRAAGDVVRPERAGQGDAVTLNLVNVPIAQAAKSVLGDVLKVNYTIADKVAGNVTVQTSQPMSRDALVDLFESALKISGAALVRVDSHYKILPLQGALASGARLTTGARRDASPGTQVQVVQLNHIAPSEMKRIIEPIAVQGSIVNIDDARNVIVVAGTQRELADIQQLVGVFDVDWMKGMSVGLFTVNASDPEAIARELEAALGIDKDGAQKGTMRILPNRRLNAVMVITSRPAQLQTARNWIHKLDKVAASTEEQLHVYRVKNRIAGELAAVLTRVLSSRDPIAAAATVGASVGPRLDTASVSSEPAPTAAAPASSAATTRITSSGPTTPSGAPLFSPATSIGATGVASVVPPAPVETERAPGAGNGQTGRGQKVVADESNNTLLITATRKEYERIQQILARIDVLPTQVMLEMLIAEVTLNDQLRFGVKWAFERTGPVRKATFSDLATGAIASKFPGFSYFLQTTDFKTAIDTLQEITKVNVKSAPSLMVLDNRRATLQIGDQVPIVTQTAQSTLVAGSPVVNTITQRDTGIILNVAPRVSDSGRIVLDVEQEVSNVVQTTSSGIDSPTIQQRRLKTTVVVADGEVIALGGLIQERDTVTKSQIPFLGNIPVIGAAFRQKSDQIERTELMIFIRPTVARDAAEARDITEEFRHRMSNEKLTTQKGRDIYDRDRKRILH